MNTPLFWRRSIIPLFCLLLLPACTEPAASTSTAPKLRWISTTEDQRWQEQPAPAISPAASAEANTAKVDPAVRYQEINGFGGCFNELGWAALLTLDDATRAVALQALFDPAMGCGFSNCRVGMGANDFALEWYSFDETPDDFAMEQFSIDRDREKLIPYIKAAMKYQPHLLVWGVPWSPPSWMKTNGAYKGGNMKQDAPTLAAYALYFSKFVQAYRQAGINLYAVHPQNEPIYNNGNYPQCRWTGAELNVFLRDYLLPQLQRDQVDVQVWLGTIVSGRLGDFVDPALGDPVTGPRISGVGYQYGGQSAFAATHAKYPDKILMQTETECYKGENSWTQALATFGKISQDLNNFANGYDYWNMILNEVSTSSWGWKQNSLLKIDTQAKKIIYNPEFYTLKHFSHFVPPGSHRVAVTGSPLKNISAFETAPGELTVVFSNDTAAEVALTLQVGAREAKFAVPAKSMNTVVLSRW